MLRSTIVAACLLLGAFTAQAHPSAPFTFSPLGGRPDVQPIAPGQSGSYAFRVQNPVAAAGVAYVHAYLESRVESVAQYSFVSANAACGAPAVEQNGNDWPKLFFPVTLPAGGSVECHYVVQRAAASSDDLGFVFIGSCSGNGCVVRRGSFTDQSLSVQPAPQPGDGVDRFTVRLVVHNHGTQSGATRDVTTECGEFGGGVFDPVPFVVENDFPGACPDGEAVPSEGCLNLTGQNFHNFSMRVGAAPPGGEASCLVRLRYPAGRIEPASVALYFGDDRVTLAGGASAFDLTDDNDATSLGYAPTSTTHAIPLPRSALALLVAVFLASGVWLVRRR